MAYKGGLDHVPRAPRDGSIEQPLTALMGFMVLAAMGLNRRPMPLLMSASASSRQAAPERLTVKDIQRTADILAEICTSRAESLTLRACYSY